MDSGVVVDVTSAVFEVSEVCADVDISVVVDVDPCSGDSVFSSDPWNHVAAPLISFPVISCLLSIVAYALSRLENIPTGLIPTELERPIADLIFSGTDSTRLFETFVLPWV